MRIEGFFVDLMEVTRIFFKDVVGCQIHAAAKPEDIFLIRPRLRLCHEHPHVHVRRWNVRVTGMQHHRNTHRLPGATSNFGTVCGRRRRQGFTHHMTKQHARAFKHLTTLDQARNAAATFVAFPFVGTK